MCSGTTLSHSGCLWGSQMASQAPITLSMLPFWPSGLASGASPPVRELLVYGTNLLRVLLFCCLLHEICQHCTCPSRDKRHLQHLHFASSAPHHPTPFRHTNPRPPFPTFLCSQGLPGPVSLAHTDCSSSKSCRCLNHPLI